MEWVSQAGKGSAVALCPSAYPYLVDGGAYSTGTNYVGTGAPNAAQTGWEVAGAAGASVTAYAFCGGHDLDGAPTVPTYFYQTSAKPPKGSTIAEASCTGAGDLLVSGWATGETWEGPGPEGGPVTEWFAGGSTGTTSYAECVTALEIADTGVTVKAVWAPSSNPKYLYLACDDDGDVDVLGGFFGHYDPNNSPGDPSYLGPPQRQYPGDNPGTGAAPPSAEPKGFWFYSADSSMRGWIACWN